MLRKIEMLPNNNQSNPDKAVEAIEKPKEIVPCFLSLVFLSLLE